MHHIPRTNYRRTGNLSDIRFPLVRPREGICSRIALLPGLVVCVIFLREPVCIINLVF